MPSLLLALLALAPGCTAFRSHDAVIQGLTDPDAGVRYEDLLLLEESELHDPDAQAELCDHALKIVDDDTAVPVRLVAIRILGRLAKQGLRTKEIADKLLNRAQKTYEPDFWCRIEALASLGSLAEGPQNRLPDEKVIVQTHEALLLALKTESEPERDVRIHAARELALLHPDTRKALDGLVAALSDETPDVRYHAQRALLAITGNVDHGPTRQDWERWVKAQADRGEGPK